MNSIQNFTIVHSCFLKSVCMNNFLIFMQKFSTFLLTKILLILFPIKKLISSIAELKGATKHLVFNLHTTNSVIWWEISHKDGCMQLHGQRKKFVQCSALQ